MRRLLLALCLLSVGTAFAQEIKDRTLCDATIPVSSPTKSISIVSNSIILMTTLSHSSGRMTMRNDTGFPITEYALLLEAFDASHKRLYGLVFHESSYKEPSTPFDMIPVFKLRSALEPGTSYEAFGESPVVSTRCPTSVVLSFAFLKFANGQTITHSSIGWRTDSGLAVPTDHVVLGDCDLRKGVRGAGTLDINSEGTLQSLVLHSPDLTSTLTCLHRELALWDFAPAIVEGRASASRLKLLVLVDPDAELLTRWPVEYSREAYDGVTVLVLTPWNSESKEWNASFGGNCCVTATKFHP